MIVSTPGHTPGHQSLLVRLPKSGAVVLSGDMVHFQDNWDSRIIPARNFDKKQSAESMDRVARLLEDEHAKLVDQSRQGAERGGCACAGVRA